MTVPFANNTSPPTTTLAPSPSSPHLLSRERSESSFIFTEFPLFTPSRPLHADPVDQSRPPITTFDASFYTIRDWPAHPTSSLAEVFIQYQLHPDVCIILRLYIILSKRFSIRLVSLMTPQSKPDLISSSNVQIPNIL